MTNAEFSEFKSELISLGFSFYGESSRLPADPERTVLKIVSLIETEPKIFRMLLKWLELTRELIHVERLKSLSQDLDQKFLLVLGAVSLKQVHQGDRRFSTLVEMAKKKKPQLKKMGRLPTLESDAYLIEKHGIDPEFLEFSIEVPKYDSASDKKILALSQIVSAHPWLKLRALMGANFRADLAYLMVTEQVKNPYQAAKLLGCSMETSYRLWKGIELYPDLKRLAG
jgi:hypothetical protein